MNMNFGSLNKEPDQRFPSDQRYTNYNEERAASSRLQPRDASIEPPGETFTVGQADVLCGRGRLSFNNRKCIF